MDKQQLSQALKGQRLLLTGDKPHHMLAHIAYHSLPGLVNNPAKISRLANQHTD